MKDKFQKPDIEVVHINEEIIMESNIQYDPGCENKCPPYCSGYDPCPRECPCKQ